MAKKKKEEVEVPLIHRIQGAKYFLAQYIPNFNTAKEIYSSVFDHTAPDRSEPVFKILDVLDGPEIPDGLSAGEYLVITITRKFKVTAHTAETVYTTKELK
jgi:hypothetical protein